MTALRTASYSGPRRNFSFSSYYDRHSTAHIKLLNAKKPMTVEQQIDTFVQGIQCATAQSIVVNLAGDRTVRTTFETYYNAVASRLELSLSLTNPPTSRETRNVNSLSRNKKTSYKGKIKNDKFNKNRDNKQNFVPECKSYSSDEWRKLSIANKEKVKALFKAKQSQNGNTGQLAQDGRNQTSMIPYPPPRHVQQFGTNMNSTQMVPYTPQYHPNMRSVGSVQLPPYPTTMYPTPPPPPPSTSPHDQSHVNSSINSSSGDVGQCFGGNNGYF